MYRYSDAMFILMGIWAMATGLKGVVHKRPFAFSGKWSFSFIAWCSLTQLVMFWPTGEGLGIRDPVFLMCLATQILVLAVFWFTSKGYFIFGVTDKSFRNGLHHALGALGLAFEERLSIIHLPAEGIDIQAEVKSSMGGARIKAKTSAGRAQLRNIAREMNRYFAKHQDDTNLTMYILYIVLGVMMLLVVAYTVYSRSQLRH